MNAENDKIQTEIKLQLLKSKQKSGPFEWTWKEIFLTKAYRCAVRKY